MLQWLQDALTWLLDALLWIPRKLWELVTDGLASVIEAIDPPDFMENLDTSLSSLDPGILYFASAAQIGPGIGMILAAFVLRFLIRRLPIIG